MTQIDRRRLLALGAAALTLPPAIQKAWAIDAKVKTGTIKDIDHIVILMQENRSFDHYFGTLNGVRGFGDRFPIPLPEGRTVWRQSYTKGEPKQIAPFPLNTAQTFAHMRVEGTPHSWPDAQYGWDQGRLTNWPDHKNPHSMGYFEQADIPFQFALANAFTICDAYHCSFTGGTNTNRLFLWSGTNDGLGTRGGPSISNSHDTLPEKQPLAKEPYTWTTYPERLEAAGISWKIYEDMIDNFGDNPLVGFKAFRDSIAKAPGSNTALAAKGHSTQHLDVMRADVAAGTLPQVSWVIAPSFDSEHPGPSSPAQGADYIARVLDCLTSNPDVWARTALLVNFDENDGYFDHMPPPAPPAKDAAGKMLGGSTVDTAGEYHLVRAASEKTSERDNLMDRPYGLGPRVPLYVISPFARGGFVNSEVFDHTSVIRFCETRFGVAEPNISPWRRAVCGDLTSCFDFKTPNEAVAELPATAETAQRAKALPGRTKPPTPAEPLAPIQATGVRRSRPLPYVLDVRELATNGPLRLRFENKGKAAAVFHAYDCQRLDHPPRRYTVEPGKSLEGDWQGGAYDVCVYGPNGFFRSFVGNSADAKRPLVAARIEPMVGGPINFTLGFEITTRGAKDRIQATPAAYAEHLAPKALTPPAQGKPALIEHRWSLMKTSGWYDFVLTREGDPSWKRRYAGRHEIGGALTSDPAMGGAAMLDWKV
ncbi:MAG TPA: phospholipase C, phosphocholine-specific [Hyphomonadaceae bacterium]|nr:phospholipase C, phosphocholine-specific [Hyphomonadaceae bacterium]HPN05559.1 phospholipase C, phosphocholine-specific [Hyphomonadaceae bacterium]